MEKLFWLVGNLFWQVEKLFCHFGSEGTDEMAKDKKMCFEGSGPDGRLAKCDISNFWNHS